MPRTIIHIDLDAFFCSVEEKHNRSLLGKPFAVGSSSDQRGVVASCSYSARLYGVRSAMPMAHAVKLCSELLIVPHRHHLYTEESAHVMALLRKHTPLVEQVSVDEAFLNVSDLSAPPSRIAQELQTVIRDNLGLPCSLGVARNKLVAKVANNVGKDSVKTGAPPLSIKVVPPGTEALFLAPLPVWELWGVGPKTATSLKDIGVYTIGDLANQPRETISRLFGKAGHQMSQYARGIDDRPVVCERVSKSISHEFTFEKDVRNVKVLRQTLRLLSAEVGRRLREKCLAGSSVRLKLRWPNFTTLVRQVSVQTPLDTDSLIYQHAINILDREWQAEQPVRLIGVSVARLLPAVHQLPLWKTQGDRERSLLLAIDDLRERYGADAVQLITRLEENY